jgi:hypothetical protein
METLSKESGLMTKQMVTESIPIPTVLNMKDTGKTTCSMGMEKKYGQMDLDTKAITLMARSMVEGTMYGLMEAPTMVNGLITRSKVTEGIFG